MSLHAVLFTDSPINSTALDITPQAHLELSQIAASRIVEQPASVTHVPLVQEEQPGLDAVHGAGSVINLAQQDMILTAAAGNSVSCQGSGPFLCHCGKECTR